jgi:drug/metabolite transporter (DMT)-like permease
VSREVCEGGHVSDSSPVEKRRMPTSVRVAVLLLALLGVLLLATSALIVLQQDAYVDGLVQGGQSRDAAGQTALLLMIAYAFMGVTALVSAAFLPRHRAWARLSGLLVLSLLTVVSLLLLLFNGVVTPQVLLILASAIAGTASLTSKHTKRWVQGPVRMD